ncbi:pentapeptide repeat-containing protein [Coleofasciculus sp. E1-EBD-02]|uniref:pentapeptide repeat-containing protein n=2 Tax=unclassified Coleofasciculus TaxID=2692782 RepID=UPI0032F4F646
MQLKLIRAVLPALTHRGVQASYPTERLIVDFLRPPRLILKSSLDDFCFWFLGFEPKAIGETWTVRKLRVINQIMNHKRLITTIFLMLLSPVATVNVNAVATAATHLLKDADTVRQLLETNSCMGCDLREVNLEDAKLKGANLRGANLRLAQLSRVELSRADLVNVILRNADLMEASLVDTNLSNADLRDTNLIDSFLTRANLSNALLENANLTNAYLKGANLEGANLQGANLDGADWRDAILCQTTLADGTVSNRDC